MSQTKAQLVSGSAAQDLTVDNINTTSINSGQVSGRRNIIINGAMQVAQRGTSSTSSGHYTVDRFKVTNTGTDESPTQAQVDVASGTTPYTSGFRKALKVTNGNQTGGAGAADFIWIQHIIEAQDIATSGWNYTSSSSYVTLSFWIKSSVAQDFKGYLRTRDGTNYEYPFATGALTADTWTKVTKTISGNSNLQLDTDNEAGLEINLFPFLGTDRTDNGATENAWATYNSAQRTRDNTSTWYTTNDATLEITGYQLEVGSTATDFEHRSFHEELQLCKRYFQKMTRVSQEVFCTGYYESDTIGRHALQLPVTMRTDPTTTFSAASTFTNIYTGSLTSGTSIGIINTSPESVFTTLTVAAGGGTDGQANLLGAANSQTATISIDAEL